MLRGFLEERLGRILGSRRDDVVLSTKGGYGSQTVIGQTATLELTPQQSQIITVAQQMSDQGGGKLTLALRSVADSRVQPGDSANDAVHLIGGTRKNGAITVVRDGVATDVSTIR